MLPLSIPNDRGNAVVMVLVVAVVAAPAAAAAVVVSRCGLVRSSSVIRALQGTI